MITDPRAVNVRDRSPSIEDQPEICQDEIDETHSVLSNDVPKKIEPPQDLQSRTSQSPVANVAPAA